MMAGGMAAQIFGGIMANSAARKAARSLNTNPNNFDAGLDGLNRAYDQQAGRNTYEEATDMARSLDVGQDRGEAIASAAGRGAGRNAVGAIGDQLGMRGDQARASYGRDTYRGIESQRQGYMGRLMGEISGGKRWQEEMANNNKLAQADLRGQGTRSLWGSIAGTGATAFGYGAQQYLGGQRASQAGGRAAAIFDSTNGGGYSDGGANQRDYGVIKNWWEED
jgi:hypothetical protein